MGGSVLVQMFVKTDSDFNKNGGGEIRTHGTFSGTTVFKTVVLNHSTTPPNPKLFWF